MFGIISKTHPLYFIVLYFFLIPSFAYIYTLIPGGFYAPYARIESASASIRKDLVQILKNDIEKQARVLPGDKGIKINPNSIFVQLRRVDSDSAAAGIFTTSLDDRNKPSIQSRIEIILRSGGGLVREVEGGDTDYFWFVEDNKSIYVVKGEEALDNSLFEWYFRPDEISKASPVLRLSESDIRVIEDFFRAMGGDSGKVGRNFGE